ncbi:MAG TPA: hypothetical protein VHN37_14255 [Actinomycetota bacterium]|nr:hypothetical protein [Actinomycetota bacterium]
MTRTIPLLLALTLCAACSTLPEGQRSNEPATGPPQVRAETIAEHARQFDEEEPDRPAGSQDELAASVYIVAHLTDAGYVSRLDAVPVEDLVRSTNVVALPPSGEEPEALVVVAYDTGQGSAPGGHSIGVWLEVARALRAVEELHSVQFVALGAEHATVEGGRLGSRRLAQQLEDDGGSPPVFVIQDLDDGGAAVSVDGAAAAALTREARALGLRARSGAAFDAGPGEVFTAAGLDTTVVGGDAEAAGRVLLAYLATL